MKKYTGELILIRHACSLGNEQKIIQGQTCLGLSEAGIEQAKQLGKYLRRIYPDTNLIYASPLERAKMTAEIVASCFENCKIELVEGLKEVNLGKWEGKTREEIMNTWPSEYKKWISSPADLKKFVGETIEEASQRIIQAVFHILTLESLNTPEPSVRKIVISHAGIISIFLTTLFNINKNNLWSFVMDNTGITIVNFYQHHPRLKLFNSTAHLLDECENLLLKILV